MDARDTPSYQRVTKKLEDMVGEYDRIGVLVLNQTTYWTDPKAYKENRLLFSEHTIRRFVRNIAKEQKRPFIYAERTKGKQWINGAYSDVDYWSGRLYVRKTKKEAPLVAHLLLGGAEHGYSKPTKPLMLDTRTKSIWAFHFYGDDGIAILDNWLEQCETNPEFRKILKLPQVVTTEVT